VASVAFRGGRWSMRSSSWCCPCVGAHRFSSWLPHAGVAAPDGGARWRSSTSSAARAGHQNSIVRH
jgi:hypothetical protein